MDWTTGGLQELPGAGALEQSHEGGRIEESGAQLFSGQRQRSRHARGYDSPTDVCKRASRQLCGTAIVPFAMCVTTYSTRPVCAKVKKTVGISNARAEREQGAFLSKTPPESEVQCVCGNDSRRVQSRCRCAPTNATTSCGRLMTTVVTSIFQGLRTPRPSFRSTASTAAATDRHASSPSVSPTTMRPTGDDP